MPSDMVLHNSVEVSTTGSGVRTHVFGITCCTLREPEGRRKKTQALASTRESMVLVIELLYSVETWIEVGGGYYVVMM